MCGKFFVQPFGYMKTDKFEPVALPLGAGEMTTLGREADWRISN
jgi:hypothetical protein